MGSCILNYTRNQFCGGRKPECPEETLEVRLRSTETRSTYNFVVEVEGVIDVHYASLTSQGVQHRVFYRDGHSSRYQPRPTGLNFGEQTGTGVFPLVIAVPLTLVFVWTGPLSSLGRLELSFWVAGLGNDMFLQACHRRIDREIRAIFTQACTNVTRLRVCC